MQSEKMPTTENITAALLAELRAAGHSWYRIARTLKVTDQSVQAWRKGASQMSNDTAARACAFLMKSKKETAQTMAELQIQVARTEEAREVWKDVLKRLGGVAATLALALGLWNGPTPPAASASMLRCGTGSVYYVKSRRLRRTLGRLLRAALVALGLTLPLAAHAGSGSLGVEFTLYPQGALLHWWEACEWQDTAFDQGDGSHGIQCTAVPGTVVAIIGTSTVKGTGNEVLASVWCGGQRVWIGEHYKGTIAINVGGLADAGITGPCYVGIQSLGPYSRSGYELQLTIFYR